MNTKFEKLYQDHKDKAAFAIAQEFDSREEMNAYIDYRLLRDKGQSHEEASETVIAQLPQREKEAQLETRRRAQYLKDHREEIKAAISRDRSTVARMGLRQNLDE